MGQFNLATLDKYAKSLTTRQTNMLYENRMHKKYKPLNEAFEPDADEYFSVFVSNDALGKHDSNRAKIVLQIAAGKDYIKYKATNYGVWFYVTIPDDYIELLGILKDAGYADDIMDSVDEKYRYILVDANA